MIAQGGITHLSESIKEEFLCKLPTQRKTQRDNLSLLIATMLVVRSPNTVDLASSLPRKAERLDMRYQWISRVLSNRHIDKDEVISPFASEVLEVCSKSDSIIVLSIDQSNVSSGKEMLMVSVRFGNRSLPIAWCVKETKGNIGFEEQKDLLDKVFTYIPHGASVVLMGDRFYGTPELVTYCKDQGWDYRLRLKGNLLAWIDDREVTTKMMAETGEHFMEAIPLTKKKVITNIGIIHDKNHPEPWIIAMGSKPDYYKTLDYGMRWGIEAMFSDFKTRGFSLQDTQIQHTDRLERLILIMAIAIYFAVSIGMWDAKCNPMPYEKKL